MGGKAFFPVRGFLGGRLGRWREGCGGMRRGCTKILRELAGGGRVVKGREGKFSSTCLTKFGNYGCGWNFSDFHLKIKCNTFSTFLVLVKYFLGWPDPKKNSRLEQAGRMGSQCSQRRKAKSGQGKAQAGERQGRGRGVWQ